MNICCYLGLKKPFPENGDVLLVLNWVKNILSINLNLKHLVQMSEYR